MDSMIDVFAALMISLYKLDSTHVAIMGNGIICVQETVLPE